MKTLRAKEKLEFELANINKKLLIAFAILFCVVEVFIFFNARSSGLRAAQDWILNNQNIFSQAIFLENVHAVNGLVERAIPSESNLAMQVSVIDQYGRVVAKSAHEDLENVFYKTPLWANLFGFSLQSDLFFNDEKMGALVVRGAYPLDSVIQHTLLLLIFLLVLFIYSKKLMASYYGVVLKNILDPLLSLKNVMNHREAGLALEMNGEKPAAGTVVEVTELYEGFYSLIDRYRQSEKANQRLVAHQAMSEIARQVAHDIRSPLSALSMAASQLNTLPEENRQLIRKATQRINDIANGLLALGRSKSLDSSKVDNIGTGESFSKVMLVALIDEIISEKRTQYKREIQIQINAELNNGYGIFVNVNPSHFSRAVSNLINNAIEAIEESGLVSVNLYGDAKSAYIEVFDNGKGMSPEILSQIGKRGFSFGKDKASQSNAGSGLGLSQVYEVIEAAGGKVKVSSKEGAGTMVRLQLPIVGRPSWFVNEITLVENSYVVSIDDDETIHQIWSQRLSTARMANVTHLKFTTEQQVSEFLSKTSTHETCLFLVDYEFLGATYNGLDIIKKLGISSRAILVTSHYDDLQILQECEKLGVSVIPKNLASIVPIKQIPLPLNAADRLV